MQSVGEYPLSNSIAQRALAAMRDRRAEALPNRVPVQDPLLPISYPGAAWHVVMTNVKCEFRAKMGLEAKGFTVYLPVEKVKRRHARRTTVSLLPLFRRYLFVAFDPDRDEWFSPIKLTDGVEDMLCYPKFATDAPDVAWMPLRVPAGEIEALKRREAAGDFDYTNAACAFTPGQSVRIADAGAMTGLNAIVHSTPPNKRVEILLSVLGRQTIVKLEANQLEGM